MRFNSRLLTIICGALLTLNAFGGSGMGGGASFTKTTLLLQSLRYEEAVLSFEGSTPIPEGETAPQLIIPADEYSEFLKEVEKEVTTGGTPFVLKVEGSSVPTRTYELRHVGEFGKEPLFLYLVEISD